MGLSIGLDTAVTGLHAMQAAIDTAAQNIANANTDGYSRQEVAFRAVPPARGVFGTPGIAGQDIGLGVDSSRVRRLRDTLLDTQYRGVRTLKDEYTARAGALQQAEATMGEPSDQGLQALMAKFFNAFRDVAAQPESVAARTTTIEQGATLASAFNRTSALLTRQRADIDSSVATKVSDLNDKVRELASLNGQIRLASNGGSPNDLMDRRDLLLDQISGMAGVRVENGDGNTVNVYLGDRALVDNITANTLAVAPDADNNGMNKVVWEADGADANVSSGEIAGLLDARDTRVTGLLTKLDGIASALIGAINAQHSAGYGLDNATGLDFFTGTNAGTIAVNQTLRDNPKSLAASDAADEPGNVNVANALAGVQSELVMNGGTATIDDAYRAAIAALGADSRQAQTLSTNQDALTRQIDTARQSVSGVSMDEEMTGLMKAQKAYQAAARVISIVDSMLDTLVNRTI